MLEVGLGLIMFVVILGVLGLIVWNGKRQERKRENVKASQVNSPDVMSRTQSNTLQESPLSLRQTAPQTDRQTGSSALPRNVMLDIYRLLREHNIARERARPVLKSAGIPLDNNLWTEAMPPDDDADVTPIAGRPTKASYYPDDPELAYQPPPH